MEIDNANIAMMVQAQLPLPQPLFGLIIPGKPVLTDFAPVDATKFSLTVQCDGTIIPTPSLIREIVFFLTNPAALPPNHGMVIYWQITASNANMAPSTTSTGFELLGAVTAEQPSAVLATGWSENVQIAEMSSGPAPTTAITFGLSLEPIDNMVNMGAVQNRVEQGKLHVARKIAGDLFRYMQSFDTGAAAQHLVVPNNIFDRWFQRFENRFRRDPNFFLKSDDDL